ncbi:MAG: phosphoribosylformylglycinamidine synthase subunit PurS [Bacteroidetes bacterium]|nr:phosphoribosylformylglycinamidine synthase subunit PurS [Bacteroidota bacterium]
MYKARINITLRSSILDPQGKAAHNALTHLGFENIDQVRIGKYIEMGIDAESVETAETVAREACRKLLANPVMEDFDIQIVSTEG